MKKLASFTIIELMMAMLISSIVTGIVYYAFFLLQTRFSTFYTSSNSVATYRLFKKAFQRDMENAMSITTVEDNHHLLFQFAAEGPVDYSFGDSCIVRKQSAAVDSFSLVQALDSIRYQNDSVPLVSQVSMTIKLEKEMLPLTFAKNYTSKELVTYYPHE